MPETSSILQPHRGERSVVLETSSILQPHRGERFVLPETSSILQPHQGGVFVLQETSSLLPAPSGRNHYRSSTYQINTVTNESGIPTLSIKLLKRGFSPYAEATIAAVTIGAIAASKMQI
ncbi:MAG: hypothetical protein RLZZ543_2299 [Bacteroidota bacterium]